MIFLVLSCLFLNVPLSPDRRSMVFIGFVSGFTHDARSILHSCPIWATAGSPSKLISLKGFCQNFLDPQYTRTVQAADNLRSRISRSFQFRPDSFVSRNGISLRAGSLDSNPFTIYISSSHSVWEGAGVILASLRIASSTGSARHRSFGLNVHFNAKTTNRRHSWSPAGRFVSVHMLLGVNRR